VKEQSEACERRGERTKRKKRRKIRSNQFVRPNCESIIIRQMDKGHDVIHGNKK
jgi:hypothetical protein